MNIAIVSGKGGTGKTLVATNLAYLASRQKKVRLVDLDVEEPNDRLFFKTDKITEKAAEIMMPDVDNSICNSCGKCSEVCQFNAIINYGADTLVFPELCHSCYACYELCPVKAIKVKFREIGKLGSYKSGNLQLTEGRLNVGELSAPFLIKKVKDQVSNNTLNFLDCPPGNSCSLVEAISDADFVVVVTEPTLFGLHDFKAIVETLYMLKKDFGVVINKYSPDNKLIDEYCLEEHIGILGRIPLSQKTAAIYAAGGLVSEYDPEFGKMLEEILQQLEILSREAAA